MEPGGSHDRLASLASLRRLRTTLAGKVRATLRAEDKDRISEWRAWLEEAWSTNQGAVYRWLKDESYAPPVTFLSGPHGTTTANLAEMDGLLQDAWRPINCKYATDPEPDLAAFLRRYGTHMRRVPMIASRLYGPRLRKGLFRMKPLALGLDGWSLADLRSLPDRLLGWLTDLLREVERLGKWPARLAEGYTALIPKEGPPEPQTPARSHACPWSTGCGRVCAWWAPLRGRKPGPTRRPLASAPPEAPWTGRR